jgi:hypothetical protein
LPHLRLALAVLALASCQREQGSPAAAPSEARNLGLAASGLTGRAGLWLVRVREAEDGGRDRNGDGDAEDELVSVLDLERGWWPGPPLAVAGPLSDPPLLACDGASAAFAVDEAAEGGRDLNGDGDAQDRVLFVFERARGTCSNLGFAVRAFELEGELLAFAVDEAGQAQQDLDVDGDADGTVLAVYDLARSSLRTFTLRDSRPLCVRDGRVALALAERPGLDLTLDGDEDDTAVLEVYDARTGVLHNTTLALAGPSVSSAGGTFGFAVSEAAQGRGDLSGDDDADDAVFHVYDPERGLSVNLGLGVLLYPPPPSDGERFLLHALEETGRHDSNGDGDLEDLVVYVFEARAGLLIESGLASHGAAALLDGWVGLSVGEAMQGSSDLDGDGEASGNVVHVFELATGQVQTLGLDAFVLHASAARVFLAPAEDQSGVDWNQDGDTRDHILFDWSVLDQRTRNSRAGIGSVLAVAGDHALLAARETERGGDGNADGDADDLLLELYDASSGHTLALGWSAGSAAHLTPRLEVLALVEEDAQGRDLNGDGDLHDEVLHVLFRAP